MEEQDWYAGRVADCYEMGLMTGDSKTTFCPGGYVTLAEVSAVAARMHEVYRGGDGKIPVVSGPWYQGAVDYCVRVGIYSGDTFPNYRRNATRAEVAGILAAALPEEALEARNSITGLPDVSAQTPYSDAIFTLYNAGVLSGKDEYGTFQPYAYITRAEMATILTVLAQPSLRVDVELEPVDAKNVPMLPGSYQNSVWENGYSISMKMSHGLLPFREESGKWGFARGDGTVAIPAVYTMVSPFQDGYAWVEQGEKSGVIDMDGELVIPLEYASAYYRGWGDGVCWLRRSETGGLALFSDGERVTNHLYSDIIPLGDGYYQVKRGNQYGVVNRNGATILPVQYSDIRDYDHYVLGEQADGSCDIYLGYGRTLGHYDAASCVSGGSLMAVQKEGDWALAQDGKLLTEAEYDTIVLYEDSDLAVLWKDGQEALAGPDGVIYPLGRYGGYSVCGDVALLTAGENYALADRNGILCDCVATNWENRAELVLVCDALAVVRCDGGELVLFERETGMGSAALEYDWGYSWDEGCVLRSGVRCVNVEEWYGTYTAFETEDGTFGLADRYGNVLLPAQYDSGTEALNTYEFQDGYYIVEEQGYPVLYYGDPDTWSTTAVLAPGQGEHTYEEIVSVGEGYFACRCDGRWYLIHP